MSKVIKKDVFNQRLSLEEQLEGLSSQRENSASISPETKIISKSAHVLQTQVDQILEDARRKAKVLQIEAKRLLDAVHEKVEAERQQGHDEGYEEGLAEVTERLSAVGKLEDQFLKDVEPELVKLVYDICQKVIGGELKTHRETIVGMVRQALRELSGAHMTVRVNPSNLDVIKAHEAELLSVIDGTATLAIKADEAVADGGCVIESEIGTIDAQLSTQLAAIKKALGMV